MNYSYDPAPPSFSHTDPLEIVTVSVGYGDILATTLPLNIDQCDRMIVVTEPTDYETRQVCKTHGVYCLLTDDKVRHGAYPFNKGRLVERGLQHTTAQGWRLHLDADIVLPPRTRHFLKAAELEPDCIYGADRLLVSTKAQWLKVKNDLQQHRWHSNIKGPQLPLGDRWGNETTGYVPIGYFQLWHSSADSWGGIRIRPYPDRHGNACRSDVQFALQWDRKKRHSLPEFFVYHLESEPAKLGANWEGRTTKRFE